MAWTGLIIIGVLTFPVVARGQVKQATYLDRAREALQSLPDSPDRAAALVVGGGKDVREDAAKKVSDLRQHFQELVAEYQKSHEASGHEGDWKMKFSQVERDLAKIIGGGAAYPAVKPGAVADARVSPTPGDSAVAGARNR
jgi:hypothetical protein